MLAIFIDGIELFAEGGSPRIEPDTNFARPPHAEDVLIVFYYSLL
jgi:hypothetical protein